MFCQGLRGYTTSCYNRPNMRENQQRLPLIPLSDLVHFPRTHVRLQVDEPRYRRLVRDLLEREEEARLVGLVLVKPKAAPSGSGDHREIFPGGTAGRLVDVEAQPDGRSVIELEGEFRFMIRAEVGSSPYREALIEPVEEPTYNNQDAGIQMVRGEILDLAERLAREASDAFPFDDGKVAALRTASSFEEVVNAFSAEIDLPILRKLQLLVAALPDRALNLLNILKSRKQVLDLLRPFRPLAAHPDRN